MLDCMNEDQILLLISFILYWIVLAFLYSQSGKNNKMLLTNLVIHIAYGVYFLYGLNYKSEGGTALAWFLYLMLFLWAHTFIHLIQLVYRLIQYRKNSENF